MFEIVSEARCFRAAQIFRHLPADRSRLCNNQRYCAGVVGLIRGLTLQQLPNHKKRMQSKMPFSAEDGISLRLC